MKHTLIAAGAIVAVLVAGGIAGYMIANNSPTDDSDGLSDSQINEKLQNYADALNSKGGYIRSDGVNLQIEKGTVSVNNGELLFGTTSYPNHRYHMPYHGIAFVFVNN